MQVRMKGARIGRVVEQGEIFGQGIEFIEMRLLADQQIFRVVARARKLVDDVTDVSADSEIAGAPDIDCDTHRRRRSARGGAAPGKRWSDVPAPRVQRELHGEFGDFRADAPFALSVAQM